MRTAVVMRALLKGHKVRIKNSEWEIKDNKVLLCGGWGYRNMATELQRFINICNDIDDKELVRINNKLEGRE